MSSLKFKTTILVILDGWGIAPESLGNAITKANLPNFNYLLRYFPNTKLLAAGQAVGLSDNDPGNTEIGHLNLGAGRIVKSPIQRIDKAIEDKTFFENQAFKQAISHLKKYNSRLHLMGLFGRGRVHASNQHLSALLKLVKLYNLKKVYLHLFTDGRDSLPTAAHPLILELERYLSKEKNGVIASLSGRFYAMDRDRRWYRTIKAYKALRFGQGEKAVSALSAIENFYQKGITDEFIPPTLIHKEGLISKNDAIIFYNHRGERAIQLTECFLQENLKKMNFFFVTMTEFDRHLKVSAVAFPPQPLKMTLGEVLALNNLRQLRLAETEKARFVTYCFNGYQEEKFPQEERIIIPSPNVPTYDQKPEMSALPLTDTLLTKLKTGEYAFILLNFANPDMVGHTGLFKPTIKACETVDACLGKIIEAVLKSNGLLVVSADHGNAEEKIDLRTGLILTEHTTNPVPLILVNEKLKKQKLLEEGALADVAPTILALMGLETPLEMTGKNLLKNYEN